LFLKIDTNYGLGEQKQNKPSTTS